MRTLSACSLIVFFSVATAVAINIAPGDTVTENFTIGAIATASLPSDWRADKNTTVRSVGSYASAGTATEQRAGNSMSASAQNGIYNYGAGAADSATDRAVGGISSGTGSKSVNVYVKLTNNGATIITNFIISYSVEKYRNGSNAAGFAMQLYYSTDGTTWTSAGANFESAWPADGDDSGFAGAPGDTKYVTNKPLNVSLAAGNTLYLAWNYSVKTGTTTTHAQGLGLDDVTIEAKGAGAGPTPAIASNKVCLTQPVASQSAVIGYGITLATESWSNGVAQVGYGQTSDGAGWLWFDVTSYAGGIGFTGSTVVTPPIGANYLGARWISGGVTNYGWSSAGQINQESLAATVIANVTNTPPMVLTTPWDFAAGNLAGISWGNGMRTNMPLTPAGGYTTGFEDTNKAGYAASEVELSNKTWRLDNALIDGTANDKKVDAKSCRGRHPFTNTMLTAKADGVGTIALKYARYGSEDGVTFVVEYSVANGPWVQVGADIDATGVDTLADWSAALNQTGAVSIRILSTAGTTGRRVNIDNVVLSDIGGTYTGVLSLDGFSHAVTRDAASNVTFALDTVGYQTLGFYCQARRDSTGPRWVDLDYFDGLSWTAPGVRFELADENVWYTLGASFDSIGTADTRFRLVGYAATASELELKNVVVTAPVPEPMLYLGVVAVLAGRLRRRIA